MEADPDRVDIDLDLDPGAGGGPAPVPGGARLRRGRSGWLLVGLAALLVGLSGSTAEPLRPAAPAAADPLPSARVTSGAVREWDVPRLPPGDVSGDSSWCVVVQQWGGEQISGAGPCPSGVPR